MRYVATALGVLLISIPAMAAAGGPNAVSIAKRALRLAEQPRPEIKQVFSARWKPSGPDVNRMVVYCPRGMIAAAIAPESPTSFESVSGRRALVVQSRDPNDLGFGPGHGVTVTCIRGRLIGP